jgi:hypothetical protein
VNRTHLELTPMLKRILLILALSCAPLVAQTYTSTVLQNSSGNYARVVPNAPITVCASSDLASPCTTKVTTYTDQTLSVACTLSANAPGAPSSGTGCNNPGSADANGNFSVFLPSGTYRICSYAQNYQCSTFTSPSTVSAGLADPGSNGIVKRTALNVTGIAAAADLIALWTGPCNNTTFLRGDATCVAAGAVASVFGRAGAVVAQANDYTWDQIGPGSNLNTQSMGNGGLFKPLNFGNVVSTGSWLHNTDPEPSTGPTWNSPATGGTLNSGHSFGVIVTYNSAAGETTGSAEVGHQLLTIGPCASGTACEIAVTQPTLPAGFTGYTVYARDITNSQTSQQIAGCVNITGTCTVTAIPTTSAPPATNAVMPLPSLAKTSVCPPNITPISWVPDANGNLNSHEYISEFYDTGTTAGVNGGPVNPSDAGIRVGCRPSWYTDMQADPPLGKNAFFLIDHQFGNSGLHTTNQERGLWVLTQTPTNDSATRYALEGIQTEMDFNCNGCTINGSPDGEVSALSVQLSTAGASTNWTPNGFGTNGIQSRVTRNGAGLDGNLAGISGVYSNVSNGNATGGVRMNAYRAGFASTGSSANMDVLWVDLPSAKNAASIKGLVFNCSSCFTLAANYTDLFIDQRLHNWISLMNGPQYNTELDDEDGVSRGGSGYPVNASLGVTGSVTTSQIASSWTANYAMSCAGGASTYTYQLVAVDANGGQVASTTFNNNVCANPLTSGNPATLNAGGGVATSAVYRQAVRIDVYRVGGPMATGKIGSLTCNNNLPINGCLAFVDTGLTATGTVPSTNTTGEGQFAGYLHSTINTVQLASDFTSAANTNLQTIGVLTWNLDGNAKKYSFHCSLMYSQATAAVAMQFGIQAATVNPNDVSVKGRVDTQTGAASAQTTGILSNLATTTATSIVTFTPSNFATIFGADLDGTVDTPANNQGQVVNIMVQTSNSADLPTVKRGSYCTLY